jgi:soluble lytic murein transglycosylase-like protein
MRKVKTLAILWVLSVTNADAHGQAVYDQVSAAALAAGVPQILAHEIVNKESGYKPNSYYKGAYGLGQIKCNTAKQMGFKGDCKTLFDPDTNLKYSMLYLRKALERAAGDPCHAATLYNRGFSTTKTTSTYCKNITRKRVKLEPIEPPKTPDGVARFFEEAQAKEQLLELINDTVTKTIRFTVGAL